MIVMVVITLTAYLPLPLGVIGHEGGTLLVVANGLRLLLPIGKKAPQPAQKPQGSAAASQAASS